MEGRILGPQLMGSKALDLFHHFCGGIRRKASDEQMHMIRHNLQREHIPAPLFTLASDEPAAIGGNVPNQYRLSTLRAKDQVVDNQMDAVLIPSVFHVDTIGHNDMDINS